MASDLPYLRAYPVALQEQARDLLEQGQLANVLLRKYPQPHSVRSDKALYDYVQELKTRYLRNAGTVNKVLFDNKIHVVRNALGLHTAVSRVQVELRAVHDGGEKIGGGHQRLAVVEAVNRRVVAGFCAHQQLGRHDALRCACQNLLQQARRYLATATAAVRELGKTNGF